jgi:hypothetical protein
MIREAEIDASDYSREMTWLTGLGYALEQGIKGVQWRESNSKYLYDHTATLCGNIMQTMSGHRDL